MRSVAIFALLLELSRVLGQTRSNGRCLVAFPISFGQRHHRGTRCTERAEVAQWWADHPDRVWDGADVVGIGTRVASEAWGAHIKAGK